MTSIVEIGNLALAHIGSPPVVNLSVDTKSARLISRLYEPSRDSVLAEHPWNAATFRASLASVDPGPAWGDELAYQLPVDWVRVIGLQDETANFTVEGGQILTTLSAPVNILYIRKVTDPNMFDPTLIAAIAARLAAELALPLTQDPSIVSAMWTLYDRKLRLAKGADAQQGVGDNIYATHYINARLVGP